VNDRIDFVCSRREHGTSQPNDGVTMHEDRWAYCSAGADHRHDWQSTGGMSLEDAKRFAQRSPVQLIGPTPQPSD
jgi:hypothetical protein